MQQQKSSEGALAVLLRETAQAHFLRTLAMPDALAALRERRDIARRLLAHLGEEPEPHAAVSLLMLDHYRALLEAELAWIDRVVAILMAHMSSSLN